MPPIFLTLPPMLLLLGACVVATPLVMWWGRVTPIQAGWQRPGRRGIPVGLGWGLLLAVAALAWLRVLLHTGDYLPLPPPVAPRPLDWLLLLVVAPLVEEPLFRGAIFGGLQRTWQPFWAYLLSSVFYVAAHPSDPWLAFLFLAGLGYAAALRQGRSLAAPMLAHSLTATALLLGRLYPAFVQALPPVAFMLAAGVAIIVIVAGASQPDTAGQ